MLLAHTHLGMELNMTIADWFRPKWRHSRSSIRWRAVESLTDQDVLANIAKNDVDWRVRETAVKRLTSQTILADVAKNDDWGSVRKAAVDRVTDQAVLADIAKHDEDEDVRKVAVDRVTDQTMLTDIAKNASSSSVRKAAVDRVTDQSALADVAGNDKDEDVRKAAMKHVTDQAVLADVVKAGKDSPVRKLARKNEKSSDVQGGANRRKTHRSTDGAAKEAIVKDLFRAAASGQVATIEAALLAGADLESRDATFEDYTMLHWAAWKGMVEAAKLLLARGANVNACTSLGETPLMLCLRQGGNLELVQHLVDCGANVNACNSSGESVLRYAFDWAGGTGSRVFDLLIQKGAKRPSWM
jgi:hypothetical protein